jgi:hypothetical protein
MKPKVEVPIIYTGKHKNAPHAGDFKVGNKESKSGTLRRKTQALLEEFFEIYRRLGGAEKYLMHVKDSPGAYEKFIDRLMKICSDVSAVERTLKIEGQLTHEHKFGFTPEAISHIMYEIQSGVIDEKGFLGLPMPELPEEDRARLSDVVDGEFKEVEEKKKDEEK